MLEAASKVGIKETKELVVLVAVGYEGITRARADGKIDTTDIVYLLPIFQAIGPAISEIAGVVPELKDLDQDELSELVAAVREKSPALATQAEVLVKVQACLTLLRAAKDCYYAFANKNTASA